MQLGVELIAHADCIIACRGYSTAQEKEAAKSTQGVRVITLQEFNELLQWGILMGVCSHDIAQLGHVAHALYPLQHLLLSA